MHGCWQTQWERVVTPPRRAPCEWMEVWLICSASESRCLAGLQSSARLFISFFHCRHTLYTHTFGWSALTTLTWFSQYQKQTKMQKPHVTATDQTMQMAGRDSSWWEVRSRRLSKSILILEQRSKSPGLFPKGVCRGKTRLHVLKKIFSQESNLFLQICHRLPKMVCRFVS